MDSDNSNPSAGKVTIIVAIIGLIGTLSTLIINNWDKIFHTAPATTTANVASDNTANNLPDKGTSAAAIKASDANPEKPLPNNDQPANGAPTVDNNGSSAAQPAYTVENAVNDYFNNSGGLEKSLDGDTIANYRVKSFTNKSITLSVDYHLNPQHGSPVYLGAWFWNPVKQNNNGGGYGPVPLTTFNGTADITITLSDLKEPYTTQSILVFISEPRKKSFTHRIFYYQHTWTP